MLLETAGLTKRFGGVVAVNGVDLAVPAGQVFGLIGPNGAGKTTLINLISGHFRADGGAIRLPDRCAIHLVQSSHHEPWCGVEAARQASGSSGSTHVSSTVSLRSRCLSWLTVPPYRADEDTT